jgi:hypothetical protein
LKWKIVVAATAAPALVGRAILIKAINIVIFDAVDVCCCCWQYLLLIVHRDIAATLVDSDTVAVTPIYTHTVNTHTKSRKI